MLYKSIPALALCLLISGCQTYSALSKDAPEEYIEIVQDSPGVDVETSLKASGADYTCKDIFFGNNSVKNRRACYIKAPQRSRFKTLGVKLQDAPRAMLTDAGNAILVVGEVTIKAYLQLFSAKNQ